MSPFDRVLTTFCSPFSESVWLFCRYHFEIWWICCQKLLILTYPTCTCFVASIVGLPSANFSKILGIKKLELSLQNVMRHCLHYPRISCIDTILACDRQTDRRLDTGRTNCAMIASCCKNLLLYSFQKVQKCIAGVKIRLESCVRDLEVFLCSVQYPWARRMNAPVGSRRRGMVSVCASFFMSCLWIGLARLGATDVQLS